MSTELVQAEAAKQIESSKQLKQWRDHWVEGLSDWRKEGQKGLIAMTSHAYLYKDVRPIGDFINLMSKKGKGADRMAINKWLLAFAPVVIVQGDVVGDPVQVKFNKAKTKEDFDKGKEEKWWDYKPSKEFPEYNLGTKITMLYLEASKKKNAKKNQSKITVQKEQFDMLKIMNSGQLKIVEALKVLEDNGFTLEPKKEGSVVIINEEATKTVIEESKPADTETVIEESKPAGVEALNKLVANFK